MNEAIVAFAETNKIQIDKLYIDKFWNNINHKHWLYVDEELIKWMGFNTSAAKNKYIKLLKDNFKINEDFKTYDYDEITQLSHSSPGKNELNKEILRFKSKLTSAHNRTLHLIIF